MKILQFIVLLISISTFSQATRFTYEVKMKPDSTNRAQVFAEFANLETDGKQSILYPAKHLVRDSIEKSNAAAKVNYITKDQKSLMYGKLGYEIKKDYKTQNIYFITSIKADKYQYAETKPFHWKILKETQQIGIYNTQKAETTYGGRKWIAWFSTEIPIPDGPYKFSGLPGLIVKAEDSKGDYSFTLVGTKKITQIYDTTTPGQIIKVKKQVYQDMEKRQFEDLSTLAPPPPMAVGTTASEPKVNHMDKKRTEELQAQINLSKKMNNNPIEFY